MPRPFLVLGSLYDERLERVMRGRSSSLHRSENLRKNLDGSGGNNSVVALLRNGKVCADALLMVRCGRIMPLIFLKFLNIGCHERPFER